MLARQVVAPRELTGGLQVNLPASYGLLEQATYISKILLAVNLTALSKLGIHFLRKQRVCPRCLSAVLTRQQVDTWWKVVQRPTPCMRAKPIVWISIPSIVPRALCFFVMEYHMAGQSTSRPLKIEVRCSTPQSGLLIQKPGANSLCISRTSYLLMLQCFRAQYNVSSLAHDETPVFTSSSESNNHDDRLQERAERIRMMLHRSRS